MSRMYMCLKIIVRLKHAEGVITQIEYHFVVILQNGQFHAVFYDFVFFLTTVGTLPGL